MILDAHRYKNRLNLDRELVNNTFLRTPSIAQPKLISNKGDSISIHVLNKFVY